MNPEIKDIIIVIDCPCCKKTHPYIVEVDKSTYLGQRYVPATPRKYKLIVTCPVKMKENLVEGTLILENGENCGALKPVEVYDDIDIKPEMIEKLIKHATSYYEKLGIADQMRAAGVIMATPPGGWLLEKAGIRILGLFYGTTTGKSK